MPDDRWWRRLDALILEAVPEGGRVLDVGCGDGGLVDRLTAEGLDAHGIDPRAPERHRLIRARVEDWHPVIRFDAVCAVMSLHHARLDPVLDAIARCLDPNGQVFIYEFAWEDYDERAASWLEMHNQSSGDNSVTAWQVEHSDLHTGIAVREAVTRAFKLRDEASCPYLARMLGRHDLEDEEHALIGQGELPSLGRRYVAAAPQ